MLFAIVVELVRLERRSKLDVLGLIGLDSVAMSSME
jgi:hypothetical protein